VKLASNWPPADATIHVTKLLPGPTPWPKDSKASPARPVAIFEGGEASKGQHLAATLVKVGQLRPRNSVCVG